MRTTVREYKEMDGEELMDALLAELEEKSRRPDLTPEEREAAEAQYRRAKEQLAARRGRQARTARAA